MQTYSCNDCGKKWGSPRREKTFLEKQLWNEYIFRKQTVRELVLDYDIDNRLIRTHLENYTAPKKIHHARDVRLVVDGTYWGERIEETSWCSIVGRDPKRKEDLWWSFEKAETTSAYVRMKQALDELGYLVTSVTGDGFSGIRQAFSGIPFQMCHVHMERLVIQGTTKHPELEPGIVLLALAKSLHETDAVTFDRRLKQFIEKYRAFLNEKTIHPLSGETSWTHDGVRQALNSLLLFQKYLFTFERDARIYKTTNSLEGHFRHIEDIVNVHCGLTRPQKEKVLNSIFLAGTIAPDQTKLDEIL